MTDNKPDAWQEGLPPPRVWLDKSGIGKLINLHAKTPEQGDELYRKRHCLPYLSLQEHEQLLAAATRGLEDLELKFLKLFDAATNFDWDGMAKGSEYRIKRKHAQQMEEALEDSDKAIHDIATRTRLRAAPQGTKLDKGVGDE